MRGRGCAAAIAHDEDAMAVLIGHFQQRQHLLQMRPRDGLHHLLQLSEVVSDGFQSVHCPIPSSYTVDAGSA